MASYVESTLTPGEDILYRGRVSVWSLLPLLLIGLVFVVYVKGAGVIFWLIAYVRYVTTELAVTNKRVIAKYGFISRTTVELNIRRAESVQVIQSILGRLLNYGEIIISGAGNPQAPIAGIHNPLGFRRAFLTAQEQPQSEN